LTVFEVLLPLLSVAVTVKLLLPVVELLIALPFATVPEHGDWRDGRARPLDVRANPLRLLGEFGAMGDTGAAWADHIGDAEGAKEPVAIGERRV
jgi:hypothetical protein